MRRVGGYKRRASLTRNEAEMPVSPGEISWN